MTIISTFHLTDQSSRQEVLFLVRGIHKYCRWNLCIEVARVLAMNRDHVLWRAASHGRSECWHTRELHFGRVGRVVINWAHLRANEDDYECRI